MDASPPDIGQLILGSLIGTLGLLALVISISRHRYADPLLASFGAFTLLWGVRFCFSTPLVSALGVSRLGAYWAAATITYLINVPAWVFFWRLIGRGWRSTIYWGVRVMAVFAVVGILSDLVQQRPATLQTANNLLVIAGIASIGATLWDSRARMPRDLGLLAIGLSTFGLLALHDNLAGLDLLPWDLQLETIGFVFLIGCLAIITARKFFHGQTQLAALESELKTARGIQMSILPGRLPATAGLSVAARFRPTSAVAGDFYDFLEIEGRGLGVVVADVSGHGVPAALIAAMVKVAFASQRASFDRPARLLRDLNQALCGNFQRGFVTATYAWIDGDSRELVVANAGHPDPLLRRGRDGSVHEVGGHGPIIGRFAGSSYDEESLSLEPGDRLVFYSDGVTEARRADGEMFGEDRLRSFVGRADHAQPEGFCDALLDELHRWSGAGTQISLEDDLTLVVVDFRSL